MELIDTNPLTDDFKEKGLKGSCFQIACKIHGRDATKYHCSNDPQTASERGTSPNRIPTAFYELFGFDFSYAKMTCIYRNETDKRTFGKRMKEGDIPKNCIVWTRGHMFAVKEGRVFNWKNPSRTIPKIIFDLDKKEIVG